MRRIDSGKIKEAVKELCLEANFSLRKDVYNALKSAARKERNAKAKNILNILVKNADIAKKGKIAICQDTGIVIVFIDIGQDVKISGDIEKAINDGVKKAYLKGFLRKSIVNDPILRKNTNDNTPAVIHYHLVKGDKIRIAVVVKGFGSENVAKIKMLKPTDSSQEILRFVADSVKKAGPDACPPFIVGIGLGGTQDKAAFLAKKALISPINAKNPKKHLAVIEKNALKIINKTKIGPMGFGGNFTALAVKVLAEPTHIAGLPVAVNINCHALRTASKIL